MDVDKIKKMTKLFRIDSVSPRHDCYHDLENRLKIYLISQFVEVCQYLSYELKLDKGVFLLVIRETTDVSDVAELHFEVAGFDQTVATSKEEAVECLIQKIMDRIRRFNNDKYDPLAIEMKLRAALLLEEIESL